MKRHGNLFTKICSLENLQMADAIARRGKSKQYGVRRHDLNREENILELRDMLLYKEYTTSDYTIFKVHDPKERSVYALDYFPHRIVHHAIMIHLEKIFVSSFTADSYASIKGKGVHAAGEAVKRALRNVPNTHFCLKLDVKQFYPSIDHDILKSLVRRKIKDLDLLWLLDDIIDSAPGLPIGNYLSQFFANYYLTGLDHYLKEVLGVENYFRYMDDMVILGSNKPYLHEILAAIRKYLLEKLKLEIKSNYQIFPVEATGIDFVGYVYRHDYTLMRKSIKQRFARAVAKKKDQQTIAAYWGWAKHCNSNHLMNKLFKNAA